MKKVFFTFWLMFALGISTVMAQTVPLSVTATQYNVTLQSSTDGFVGVTAKGFQYRLQGASSWRDTLWRIPMQ